MRPCDDCCLMGSKQIQNICCQHDADCTLFACSSVTFRALVASRQYNSMTLAHSSVFWSYALHKLMTCLECRAVRMAFQRCRSHLEVLMPAQSLRLGALHTTLGAGFSVQAALQAFTCACWELPLAAEVTSPGWLA
eukprot:4979033-Amphidinium_carterae.1